MKKIYLLYFLLLPLTAFAQADYHPFLTEGKRWNYEYEHVNLWENYHTTENVSYVIEGDMVIDGKTYKKLYYGTSDEQFSSLDDKVFHRALREEGKKVYMYDETAGDILLFDFGMQPGESYEISSPKVEQPVSLKLETLKQMTFHGREFTFMQYKWNWGTVPSIVESVGIENFGWDIIDVFIERPTSGIYDIKHFKSCYEDGECIFTEEDFYNTDDISNSTITSTDSNMADDAIYDLQGRQLNAVPEHGIYICNGKKVIGK